MPQELRVALLACTGLLGGVIRELLSALPDVDVVGDLPNAPAGEFSSQVHRLRPDVIVWRLDDDEMLADHPEFFGAEHTSTVLAIQGDGDSGALWRLRPQRARLGPLDPAALAAAIRSVAGR